MEPDLLAFLELHARGVGHRAHRRIRTLGVERALEPEVVRELAPRARGRAPTQSELDAVAAFMGSGGAVLGPGGRAGLGRLCRAPQAPLCVYARGALDLVHRVPAIGIVGTREASDRGKTRARRLAEALARQGICVVSGGARGIDLAAHQGALDAGGESVIVLGDPVSDKDERPRRVRELCRGPGWMTLTPHGPWTKPSKGLFVSRNRLIAALVDAVVVIEAREVSGTRHTARYAQRVGIPVFAVPGDPDDPLAATPNALLAEGCARPFLSIADLGLNREPSSPEPAGQRVADDAAAADVLAALERSGGRLDIDALLAMTGRPAGELLAATARLELRGAIARAGAVVERR